MELIGPITNGTRGRAYEVSTLALPPLGYREDEYFLAGTAARYHADEARGVVVDEVCAPFMTRMLVRRPADVQRFNGTVVVEWFNVSSAQDAGVEWIYTHTALIRAGYAWVGVSAQGAGIVGLPNPLGVGPSAHCLKQIDSERYSPLEHPGDDYSYDIFSQAGAAVRAWALRVIGTPHVEALIAAGVSQSAYRLTTYINAVDHLARTFDAFLVHARPCGAAPLALPANPAIVDPTPVRFRADLRVPVLVLQTETDLMTLGYHSARQEDAEHLRVWELAGAAHGDTYLGLGATVDDGALTPEQLAVAWIPSSSRPHAINCAPQHHYVANAALEQLARWCRGTATPAYYPRLCTTEEADPRLACDVYGNARGGIRTPWIEVPLATLSGIGPADDVLLRLFGSARRLPLSTIHALYADRDVYLRAFREAAADAERAGVLLRADLPEIVATAAVLFALSGSSRA